MFRRGLETLNKRSRITVSAQRLICTESGSSSDGTSPTEKEKQARRVFKKMRGTGDKGQSSLFSGERRWKDDAVFEALGACDELTCVLGIVRESLSENGFFELVQKITSIQCDVQDIAAHVATPRDCGHQRIIERTQFDSAQIDVVDSWIDDYARGLPELTQFILPGGGLLAAQVHHARTVCRRAERRVAAIVRDQRADATVLQYLNRLSDFLFVLARYSCYAMNKEEILYKKSRRPESDSSKKDKWTKNQ